MADVLTALTKALNLNNSILADLVWATMMQPETWKVIAEYSGKIWTAIGPLLGVLIGAWLGRAWDREKWERENRKEESRELLSSISHAATVILNVGRGNSSRDADEAYLDSMKVFHDRIFIAENIQKEEILDVWAHAVGDFRNGKIDDGVFSDRVSDVREKIISLVALKSKRSGETRLAEPG